MITSNDRMTDLTTPQSVLERPAPSSQSEAAPRPSQPEHRFSSLRRPAALIAAAALAIVGAMVLGGGEEVDQIEASTPSPGLATTPGISTLNGYWNSYTQEWVPFED